MDTRRNKVVGGVLRAIRLEQGLTQAQIAERLGCTQSLVSKAESGERALPFVEAWAYADALGCDPSRLLSDSEDALAERGLVNPPRRC